MRKKKRQKKFFPIFLILLLLITGSVLLLTGFKPLSYYRAMTDPHRGQVYINDGNDMVWLTPLEGVAVNTIQPNEIVTYNGRMTYTGYDYDTLIGIDVSQHQKEIDWAAVAADGIDFAIIRAGFRGYSKGSLYPDDLFDKNMQEALKNGLQVGLYVYSQAINIQEAIEEAQLAIQSAEKYNITMPVVFDWELAETGGEPARTDGLDITTRTDCAVAFCETVKAAGYTPCVYFNRHLGYYCYDLKRLTAYEFWAAVPGQFPDFYYAASLWQYSFTEKVSGISGECDMNMLFIPKEQSK